MNEDMLPVISSSNSVKKVLHRKKHKNSRLGCSQCKQRRIKCDETLPSCLRCQSKNIRCGYLDLSKVEIELIEKTHLEQIEFENGIRQTTKMAAAFQMNPTNGSIFPQELRPSLTPNVPIVHQSINNPNIIGEYSTQNIYKNNNDNTNNSNSININYSNIPTSSTTNNAPNFETFPNTINNFILQEGSPALSIGVSSTASLTSSPGQNSTKNNSINYQLSNENYFDALERSQSPPIRTKTSHDSIVESSEGFVIPLINHDLNTPKYSPSKFPSFFDETIPSVMARVYLLQEVHSRLRLSCGNLTIFNAMLLQSSGVLILTHKSLEQLFLRYRGYAISAVTKGLGRINDDNATILLIATSLLMSSSIFLKDLSKNEFFQMNSGPSVIILAAFENPEKFPKSFMKLKNHADGFLFTSRYVWNPRYDYQILYELLSMVEKFGENHCNNKKERKLLAKLSGFIRYVIRFILYFENHPNKHVLKYPIEELQKLLQNWYATIPLEKYTFNKNTLPALKIIYGFWFLLGEFLEEIFVGSRYIFTYLFHGYHLIFTFDQTSFNYGLSPDLKWYANYISRGMSYLSRRKGYIIRHTLLNNLPSIPTFFDSEDRFKTRSLNTQDKCIIRFNSTLIKPENYPMEIFISTTEDIHNGYSSFSSNVDDSNVLIDLYDFNDKTGLLNSDFDPRFTDPVFNLNVRFHDSDLEFLKKYIEDRKLILQLDDD
ncbi:hypothetical protein WICMUC_000860 [Wickerhamomyces mucosus]|uniref:Zn(2)-C6 fungal-type domain-containing protein n=1 Tax=Wickerhamomyces mucosus TaxID=1378264 RepID=A0A9P8PWI6_9ASCO|nr:hypothetical protein WICMUC_000860 [Wickerhamomyces mucosus]